MAGNDIHERCTQHSGLDARMTNLESDKRDMWKAINQIKTWVVIGMGSLVLNLLLAAVKLLPALSSVAGK